MEKWEYNIIDEETFNHVTHYPVADLREQKDRFQKWLNEMGQEGWELVGKGPHSIIFKRKLKED